MKIRPAFFSFGKIKHLKSIDSPNFPYDFIHLSNIHKKPHLKNDEIIATCIRV